MDRLKGTNGAANVTAITAGTPTGNSGNTPVALTSSATDYTVLNANASRQALMIGNNSTGVLYVNLIGGSAYSGGNYVGMQIQPGGVLILDTKVPNTAIHMSSTVAAPAYFLVEI